MFLPFGRIAAVGLALAGFVVGSGASAATTQCGRSAARDAFNVQGLKSELMVTALSCNVQDKYNAFVSKFRSHLLAEEKKLTQYFRKTYGRGAQRAHDDYITQLANAQSEKGLHSGTILCKQRLSMFDEVAALETAKDLSDYAEAKDIIQPSSYETCTAPSAGKTVKRGKKSVKHRAVRHSRRKKK